MANSNETAKTITIDGVTHQIEDATARQSIVSIQSAITSLQNALDAITNGDTTTAIETFQEVIDFLSGVTDNETLIGRLNALNTLISGKVDKVTGKGLSTEDYTTAEKTKLAGIAAGAQVNEINGIKDSEGNVLTPVNGVVILPESSSLTQQQVEDMIDEALGDVDGVEVVDNLTTNDGTKALSAKQGKVLKDGLDSKQDVLTFDNAPTANSNNSVKSGGIYTALQTLLSNITIGQNGNWFVGQTDTNIKAQGPKGNDGEDGTLTLQEGETPTLSIVADLNTDDDLSDNIKVLSAGMGKKLGIRTRLVLDEVDSEYNGTDNIPSAQDVGNGLTVHCTSDDKIRHYYVDNNVVKVIESVPDKDLIYCLAETDSLVRWDGTGWKRVGGGNGGVTIQKGTTYLDIIFGSSGNEGALGLPKITITPNVLEFDASGQTKTIVVKAKNCTPGGTIVLSSGNNQFVLSENTISVDDAENGVSVNITCNATTELSTSITAYCQEDEVSGSVTVNYVSPWAFTSLDNAALCTALYNAGLTESADGVLKSEISTITSLPNNFMASNQATSLNCLEKLTSLTTIGESAFNNMEELKGVIEFPASVTSIGIKLFMWTGGVYGTGFSITSLGNITSIPHSSFAYSKLTSVVIPASCLTIDYIAFYGCSLLADVTIEGTTTISRSDIFEGINGSAVFTCLSTTPPNLTADIPNSSGMTLRVPAGALNAYQNDSHWSKFGTIVEITE